MARPLRSAPEARRLLQDMREANFQVSSELYSATDQAKRGKRAESEIDIEEIIYDMYIT